MTRGPRSAEVVARDEHVPLGTAVPRERGVRLVHQTPVEGFLAVGAYDRHVVEAERFYGEGHARVGRRIVIAGYLGGGYLVASALRPVRDLRHRDCPRPPPLRASVRLATARAEVCRTGRRSGLPREESLRKGTPRPGARIVAPRRALPRLSPDFRRARTLAPPLSSPPFLSPRRGVRRRMPALRG